MTCWVFGTDRVKTLNLCFPKGQGKPCPFVLWFPTASVDLMAKDEARHGKAFKGLLDRYFAVDLAVDKAANFASKAAEVIGNVLK